MKEINKKERKKRKMKEKNEKERRKGIDKE